MKNRINLIAIVTLLIVALVGCAKNSNEVQTKATAIETSEESTSENSTSENSTSENSTSENSKESTENEKLNVVATIFPYYDFIRQIAGDKVK